MKWLIALFLILSPYTLYACEKGQVVYRSDCIDEKDVPKNTAEELKYYGKEISKVGERADLYTADLQLFQNANLQGKTLADLSPKGQPFDLENQAWGLYKVKVTGVLKDAYKVSVEVYDNAPVCGNTGKIVKRLRGYVPKVDAQGIPTLWQFQKLTGLC